MLAAKQGFLPESPFLHPVSGSLTGIGTGPQVAGQGVGSLGEQSTPGWVPTASECPHLVRL